MQGTLTPVELGLIGPEGRFTARVVGESNGLGELAGGDQAGADPAAVGGEDLAGRVSHERDPLAGQPRVGSAEGNDGAPAELRLADPGVLTAETTEELRATRLAPLHVATGQDAHPPEGVFDVNAEGGISPFDRDP